MLLTLATQDGASTVAVVTGPVEKAVVDVVSLEGSLALTVKIVPAIAELRELLATRLRLTMY